MDITVSDLQGGGFTIHNPHKYFDDATNVAEHSILMDNPPGVNNQSECLELSVMFDRTLHRTGTKRSPYVVVRVDENGLAGNLRRADFMAAIMSIYEWVGFS